MPCGRLTGAVHNEISPGQVWLKSWGVLMDVFSHVFENWNHPNLENFEPYPGVFFGGCGGIQY